MIVDMAMNFLPIAANGAMATTLMPPPAGWDLADYPEVTIHERDYNSSLKENTRLACREAVEVINKIQSELNIHIPESYMRVDLDNTFHVLLLTSQDDFLSPKLQAAKIVTERYSRAERRFDIRFSFTNLEENTHKSTILDNGYMLKYLAQNRRVLITSKGVS